VDRTATFGPGSFLGRLSSKEFNEAERLPQASSEIDVKSATRPGTATASVPEMTRSTLRRLSITSQAHSMTTQGTEAAVLDVAEELVQTRGYNAFSFRDLAERIGIRAASIHYYFPSKADLCRALLVRYRRQFQDGPGGHRPGGQGPEAEARTLRAIVPGHAGGGQPHVPLRDAGVDISTLPPAVRGELRGFFDDNQAWLTRVLTEGRESGKLRFDGAAEAEARLIVSGLEGAMLVARLYEDPTLFRAMTRRLLARPRAM
jgi:TetR/AcrR family transcriptional repressor of nem operon